MDKILAKDDLRHWLAALGSCEIHAPRCRDGVWSYEIVRDPTDVTLDYPMAVTPAKAMVFPQREPFLEFRAAPGAGYELVEFLPDEKHVAIFGVRPCEARGLSLLDMVFGGPVEDIYYARRRRATTLVGLTCVRPPSRDCFCASVNGSPHGEEGLDVLLTDMGDRYHVRSPSAKGEALVAAGAAVMVDATAADESVVTEIHAAAVQRMPRHLENIDDIHVRLKDAYDAPFWRREARRCINCGICTFLCPTCHCFDINDEVERLVPLSGCRVRTWDTCQYPDFTMHSSGHNPRPDAASRLRQRVSHKFRYSVEAWGQVQCTGCGRCIAFCPVGIDIIQVVERARDHVG